MSSIEEQVALTLRGLRIIIASFIAGVVVFSGVAFFLVSSGFDVQPELARALVPALGGLLLLALVASSLVRRLRFQALASGERQETQEERVRTALPVFQQVTILVAALAEGPALFGGVTYLVTGNPIGLLVSALGVIRLVLLLPSEAVVESVADLVPG